MNTKMKKNILKQLMSTALVGTLAFGLVACGGNDNEVNNTATESKVTNSTESTVTASETAGAGVEEITYPLNTDIKLSRWAANEPPLANVYTSYTESPYHMGLAENTGVDVEWIYPVAGVQLAEAYNLLLTDAELPKMIGYKFSVSDMQLLATDGLIYDLTDYIPTYAPDYWEFLNSNETLLKDSTADDGRIYGVGSYLEGDYNKTYIGPVIRQDWLDECGLSAPVTLEDWEKVLVAFKDKYDAQLGFSLSRFNGSGIGSGTGAHTSVTAGWYVEDGKVYFANMGDEYKEMLSVLNKWYNMSLIDEDSFSMDDKAVRAKVLNGEIGVSITAMSQLTNWIADAEAQQTGANWVGFEYPRTEAGEPTSFIQSQSQTPKQATVITTECTEEELIVALKWLNYGFTEEGKMYINFGTEGETYTLDAEGKPQWTSTITEDPDGMSVAIQKYTGASSTPTGTVQSAHMVQIKNNPQSAAAVYEWIENTNVGEYFLPNLALTGDETIAYNDLYTPIKAYVNEMALKFILGTESLDNYDDYIATLKEMKVADMVAIQQTAYERYLNR